MIQCSQHPTCGRNLRNAQEIRASEFAVEVIIPHNTKKISVNKEQENEMTQKALGNMLFSDLIKEWLDSVRAKVKPSSYAQYSKRIEKNILPFFAGMKLSDIAQDTLRHFVERLQAENFNEKYIYDVVTLLRSILKTVTRTYGYPDPTIGMETIRTGRENEAPLSKPIYTDELCEQLNKVLTTDTDLTKCGILMTLYTGLRIGELCALKWEDIDIKAGKVTVVHTIQRISTEDGSMLMMTDLDKKAREIPLPQFLCKILQKHKAPANRYLLSGTASPIEPRTMQYRLRSFLEKEQLPDISFSGLRKLFIKRCISHGTDVTVLADILGNTSVQSTAMYCEKPTITRKIQAINAI